MSDGYRILVFTDHRGHSMENSIYELLSALRQQQDCAYIDVASRGMPENDVFFKDLQGTKVWAARIKPGFAFSEQANDFQTEKRQVDLNDYDAIFLRLPHPIQKGFWEHLKSVFAERRIINQPSGIQQSSNKAFLLTLVEWCPPMALCHTRQEVKAFAKKFPIVLKPLEGYGGVGIVKISEGRAWLGKEEIELNEFLEDMERENRSFLAMKFLKNVDQGDKRIVVINGEVIGASLRMPPEGSWLCNASQGGQSILAELTEREKAMALDLTQKLKAIGVLFFGFDTLVDDVGQRVLSEVNTLSIGGIRQISQQQPDRPILDIAARALMKGIREQIEDSIDDLLATD